MSRQISFQRICDRAVIFRRPMMRLLARCTAATLSPKAHCHINLAILPVHRSLPETLANFTPPAR